MAEKWGFWSKIALGFSKPGEAMSLDTTYKESLLLIVAKYIECSYLLQEKATLQFGCTSKKLQINM